MTREEEANKASISYASQMCDLCLDEYCKKNGVGLSSIQRIFKRVF